MHSKIWKYFQSKDLVRSNRMQLFVQLYRVAIKSYFSVTPKTSQAGIPALRKLPVASARRYTGFVQTSLWRRTPVYRLCANFSVASHAGIPGARYVNARRHTPVYKLCFLMLTGTSWLARVIEIQTKQQLKNNLFHETQRICVNKFCIWTPSGQRTS